MNDLEQAARQALEALETVIADVKTTPTAYEAQRQAIASLRQALEQTKRKEGCAECGKLPSDGWALYCVKCSAPMREWVGLTYEEIAQGLKESWVTEQAFKSAVWWAEERLKELNT